MAEVVVMPAAGNSVESSLLSEWMVSVGDTVGENTVIAAIETDKSSMEIPAGVSGTVLALVVEEGDDVPVKEPIMVVGSAGEEVDPALLGSAGGQSEEAAAPADPAPGATAPVAAAAAAPAAGTAPVTTTPAGSSAAVSPRARGLANSKGIDATALAGSGPKGRVIERDVKAAIAAGPALTTGAKAQAQGFVPGQTGTGIGGRVTTGDLAGAPAAASTSSSATPAVSLDFPGTFTDVPMKGVRKVIADRMMESLQTSAQLALTATAPADGLLKLRKALKNAPESFGLNGVTIGDLVGYATAKTLAEFPRINSTLENDTIREYASVHLGVAVDTPRGLLVPVVRFAEQMTIGQFSARSKELAYGALDGSLSPDLMSGGTFTVSNLGAFGIEAFSPVINSPQSGILGVGAITPRATADGGVENRIWLSLTMDHQVYDGADGARFMKSLVEKIANIELTVMG